MPPLLQKLIFIALLFLVACQPMATPIPGAIHFRDVAGEVGLDFVHGAFHWEMSGDAVAMMGGGLCWLDFDNDGWLDLFVVNSYAVAEAGPLSDSRLSATSSSNRLSVPTTLTAIAASGSRCDLRTDENAAR